MVGVEVLLPLGAVAFYVYDTAQLLYSDERLIVRAGRRWMAARSAGLYWFGRTIYAPALLLPHRPIFRLAVASMSVPEVLSADRLSKFLLALRPLQIMAWALMGLLVVALPLVAWLYGAGPHMLAVFAVYYLVLLTMLLMVFLRRSQLGLSTGAFWGLLFDVCACAPFGINLVSKLTLRRSARTDDLYGELQCIAMRVQPEQL